VPFIGAAAALAVFSVIGWRMLHVGHGSTADEAKSNPSSTVMPAEPAGAGIRAELAAPVEAPVVLPPSNETVVAANDNLAQWIAGLKSDDPAERRRAATALHSLGPDIKEALPALRKALDDTDAGVRMWAAVTLVNDKCYDKATIPILLGVLRNDNPVLRQVACLSLGLIPYEQAEKETVVPILTEAAGKDTNEDVRKAALTALNVVAPDAIAKAGLK
jgi:HEAT repeat protein